MTSAHTPPDTELAAPRPSLEERIVASVLNRIRENRGPASPSIAPRAGSSESQLPAAKLREATLADCDAVIELKRRWGLIPDPCDNWDKLWVRNPALKDADPRRPFGWVLDAAGTLVGYIGNISSTYFLGDEKVSAVTAHALVVEPAYRATSVSLNAAFFRQKFADLYLGTTAIEAVDKISRIFKCDRLPQPGYDTVLFWILRPSPFAGVIAKKLNLGQPASYCAEAIGTVALATDKVLRRRWPRLSKSNLSVTKLKVSDIGGEFDRLWNSKREEGRRLLAERSSATLRWHFEIPGDRSTIEVLACHEGGDLQGYLVVRHEPAAENGPSRSIVCDILIKRDRREVLEALFVAAYGEAKHAGSHIFEVVGFPPNLRKVLQQWNPYERKFPACPFHFKAATPEFHHALLDAATWYASPYDGDTTLMPVM
jgi:hypothetical protein